MPRPHPSAREKGLVKNDTILGPLRHSGYVTTMLMAISWPALGLHICDHMLDTGMADQVPLQKKYPTEGSRFFFFANNWQKYTHSRVLLQLY